MAGKILAAVVLAVFMAVVAFLQDGGVLPDTVNPYADGSVYLHVIDVGQGSSTLIQQGKQGILIDAGESDFGDYVSDYINACGINELKYVVASHPHSDHIGGLPEVLENYTVGEFLTPEIDEENLPTTKVYENLLDTLISEDITSSYCETGDVYYLGDISMQILGPVEQVSDLNNMSAICRLSVGDTDIMVLGDAENKELKSVYKHGGNFESEILVMGHHGSRTSIYKDFMSATDPLEALISCGADNSYGHPHKETINFLMENDIEYWRTDYSGDLVYLIDEKGFERLKPNEVYG